jgi:hypothetical protein
MASQIGQHVEVSAPRCDGIYCPYTVGHVEQKPLDGGELASFRIGGIGTHPAM